MKRGKKLYVGKANTLYEVLLDDGTVAEEFLEMEATDRISAGDGAVTGVVEGKGYANNLVSTILFERFGNAGIPTHYLSRGTTPTSKFVYKAKMIPLEVIVRNYSAGSFCRRYGCKEGIKFEPEIVEMTFKDDKLHDPLIVEDAVVALKIADTYAVEGIRHYASRINEVAKEFFAELGLTLIDFKVEFGIAEGHGLVLADEFSQDTCRLHDANGKSVDKDIFRKGGATGEVSEVYNKLAKMLQEQQSY